MENDFFEADSLNSDSDLEIIAETPAPLKAVNNTSLIPGKTPNQVI